MFNKEDVSNHARIAMRSIEQFHQQEGRKNPAPNPNCLVIQKQMCVWNVLWMGFWCQTGRVIKFECYDWIVPAAYQTTARRS